MCVSESMWSRLLENGLSATPIHFSGTFKNAPSRYLAKTYESLLTENPLGSELFHSSSCIRHVKSSTGNDHLIYVKGNSVQTQRISKVNGMQFRYQLEEDSSELLDYYLNAEEGENLTVFGFDASLNRPNPLFGLRYAKAISLLDWSGDILQTWRMDNKDISSLVMLPFIDCLAMVDASGNLMLNNIETKQSINLWDNMIPCGLYRWSWLGECENDTSLMLFGTRKEVGFFDSRIGEITKIIYNENTSKNPSGTSVELVGGISTGCRRKFGQHQFYVSTTDHLCLMDDRVEGKVISEWSHGLEEMPKGCETILIDGIEYVATYTGLGEVFMIANDFNHESCVLKARRGIEMDCQNENLDLKHPVQRGHEAVMNPVSDMLNTNGMFSPLSQRYLQMPWTGLTLVSNSIGELSLFSINAAGVIFSCDVGLAEDEENTQSVERNLTWLTPHSKFDQMRFESLQQFDNKIRSSQYLRKCHVGQIFSRNINTKDVHARTKLSIVITKQRKGSITKPLPKRQNEKKPNVFRACPHLEPIDPTNFTDSPGERVKKIFNDESLYSDLSGRFLDTDFKPVDFRGRKTKRAKIRDVLEKSAIEDNNAPVIPDNQSVTDTLDGHEFNPMTTSTQESNALGYVPNEPLFASQPSVLSSSFLPSQDVSMSIRKKTKKKKDAGF